MTRPLFCFCAAFALGCIASQYFLVPALWLPAAGIVLVLGALGLLLRGPMRRRVLLCALGMAFAFGWNAAYARFIAAPNEALIGAAEDVELEIDPKDLQIDTYRSSGAGGQHVNKTESAIRITHLPTGTVVECQDERSQYKNKDKAMKVLRSRLYEAEQAKQAAAEAAERRGQVGSGDRSERIRTYNFPQGRVTDHRIGLTLYKIDDIMDGQLDELIDALITADRAEKLKSGRTEQGGV